MDKKSKIELEQQAIKQYLLPFLNLSKIYPLLPGAKDSKGEAGFIGIDENEMKKLRLAYVEEAQTAADELLKDDAILEQIDKLPFKNGDHIIAIGDSMTDDLRGWFEMLKYVVETARPELELTWSNEAVHEDTSVDALKRLNRSVMHNKPNWVFVMLGSYDAMRYHAAPDRTLVSLAEYWENMNSIENAVDQVTKNPIVWISPAPVITELMADNALFEGVIENLDLSQFRECYQGRKGIVIDPHGKRMGTPPEAWNYLPDGFYPSIAGHLATTKAVLLGLLNDK